MSTDNILAVRDLIKCVSQVIKVMFSLIPCVYTRPKAHPEMTCHFQTQNISPKHKPKTYTPNSKPITSEPNSYPKATLQTRPTVCLKLLDSEKHSVLSLFKLLLILSTWTQWSNTFFLERCHLRMTFFCWVSSKEIIFFTKVFVCIVPTVNGVRKYLLFISLCCCC